MDTSPLLLPIASLLLLGMCSFIAAPILSVRSNQRLLPLIQKPLKHPAAPDALAAVHAAQGHQRASAAWAGVAAWLISHLPSLRIRASIRAFWRSSRFKIGRASCRETVDMSAGGV